MIDIDDLFFTVTCLIRKHGMENTINIDNIRETNDWMLSLPDRTMQLAYTAMPANDTINVTLVVGQQAIDEWKAMGFQTMAGEA